MADNTQSADTSPVPSAAEGKPACDDKRLDVYLELYKQQMAYFHETRRIEFQANLALWTAIFATGYGLAGKVHLSAPVCTTIVIGSTLISGIWAFFLQKTKSFDKGLFSKYRQKIEGIVDPSDVRGAPQKDTWGVARWLLFYSIATLLFSWIVVVVINATPIRPDK